jgi:hypothetical protein
MQVQVQVQARRARQRRNEGNWVAVTAGADSAGPGPRANRVPERAGGARRGREEQTGTASGEGGQRVATVGRETGKTERARKGAMQRRHEDDYQGPRVTRVLMFGQWAAMLIKGPAVFWRIMAPFRLHLPAHVTSSLLALSLPKASLATHTTLHCYNNNKIGNPSLRSAATRPSPVPPTKNHQPRHPISTRPAPIKLVSARRLARYRYYFWTCALGPASPPAPALALALVAHPFAFASASLHRSTPRAPHVLMTRPSLIARNAIDLDFPICVSP